MDMDSETKKKWNNPEIYVINFRETEGGNTPAPDEDLEWDEFSEY
jgi:hypothetical protein